VSEKDHEGIRDKLISIEICCYLTLFFLKEQSTNVMMLIVTIIY